MTIEKIDPTRIDIDFDPTIQRMKGVARHGDTPFDVPFISHVGHNLWQGGCRDGLILPSFIDVVVSLYPWERYTLHGNATRIEVKMYDSVDQGFEQVDEIAQKVNEFRDAGKVVLVHCQAGLNRSSLIAARALFLEWYGNELEGADPITGDWIVEILRDKRSPACLCNPAFEAEVRSWR